MEKELEEAVLVCCRQDSSVTASQKNLVGINFFEALQVLERARQSKEGWCAALNLFTRNEATFNFCLILETRKCSLFACN